MNLRNIFRLKITLKKDLQYLRDEHIISTVGQGKGTAYVIKQQTE